ncbi:MAG: hypothetical protein K6G62_01645 [Eubacterium sp.]|nr:hypothetical protein [Eubacterium sp.]
MKMKILRLVLILLVVLGGVGLFLPYQSRSGEIRQNMLEDPDEIYIQEIDMTNEDAVDLSIFENFKIFKYMYSFADEMGGDADWYKGEAIINIVFDGALVLSLIFMLIFALSGKYIGLIVFDIIMIISTRLMNADLVSRGILPDNDYSYGISFYLYLIIGVAIFVISIISKVLSAKANKGGVDYES